MIKKTKKKKNTISNTKEPLSRKAWEIQPSLQVYPLIFIIKFVTKTTSSYKVGLCAKIVNG